MTEKLSSFISRIKDNEILLPDFQRRFVWTEIENQQRLIASVLASLPIGSVLLLEGDTDEFVSKRIGLKSKVECSVSQKRNYLLDGQQRLTVLTNAFSNVILKGVVNFKKELAHESLQKRFFIKFNGVNSDIVPNDLFGLSNLKFTFNPDEEPYFSSNDIYDLIYNMDINTPDKLPFDPNYSFSSAQSTLELERACELDSDTYIVPLHFLIDNKTQLRQVIKNLTERRQKYLLSFYESLKDNYQQRDKKLKEMFGDKIPNDISTNKSSFTYYLKLISEEWTENFMNYLLKSINELKVHEMEIKKAQRARAIDIYENLNLGGVSLSTFDLIIAKAAKSMKQGFYESFKENLNQGLVVQSFYSGQLNAGELWIPKDRMNIYNESRNQVSSTYINVFLNLLSLNINVRKYGQNFKLDLIKKSEILKINSEDIVSNYIHCLNSINRALMFLQMNCGIRRIDDISYEHILLGLSYFLGDEEIFTNVFKTKALEFWYWSSIFSGVYDSDQNSNIIKDLQSLNEVLYEGEDKEKEKNLLKHRENDVFKTLYFSDQNTLLMKFSEYGKLPKSVITKSICQFVLKEKPKDLIEEDVHLNAWDKQDLDLHHVIPLKNISSLKESTAELRKDKTHILNSPLNFVFILRKSNLSIGTLAPSSYLTQFASYIKTTHYLPEAKDLKNVDDVENWLSIRFEKLKDALLIHLNSLIYNSVLK